MLRKKSTFKKKKKIALLLQKNITMHEVDAMGQIHLKKGFLYLSVNT